MIRRLRKPAPLTRFKTEARRESGRWGRWVYLIVLVGFFGWLVHLLVGHLVFFQAEGLVMMDATEVATEYTARVERLDVAEGDRVERGAAVATLSSQDVRETIARISADYAHVLGRLTELRIREAVATAVFDVAREHARKAGRLRDDIEGLRRSKVTTQTQALDALNGYYASRTRLEKLRAELETVAGERKTLEGALARTESALAELERIHDRGRLAAPTSGLVGELKVEQGQVVSPGDPVMRIYHGAAHVLAFVPTGTLYDVHAGDEVTIKDGLRSYPGEIIEVTAVAPQLPAEFQRTFAPRTRAQVARIRFTGDPRDADRPPLFAKVQLSRRSDYAAWRGVVARLFGI